MYLAHKPRMPWGLRSPCDTLCCPSSTHCSITHTPPAAPWPVLSSLSTHVSAQYLFIRAQRWPLYWDCSFFQVPHWSRLPDHRQAVPVGEFSAHQPRPGRGSGGGDGLSPPGDLVQSAQCNRSSYTMLCILNQHINRFDHNCFIF